MFYPHTAAAGLGLLSHLPAPGLVSADALAAVGLPYTSALALAGLPLPLLRPEEPAAVFQQKSDTPFGMCTSIIFIAYCIVNFLQVKKIMQNYEKWWGM